MKEQANKLSRLAIVLIALVTVLISLVFKWQHPAEVNYMGGDAKDYYSPLVSFFFAHDFAHQTPDEWFLLKTSSGVVNVHPVGLALLLLPFFLLGYAGAFLFGYATNGYTLPFQIVVGIAALVYALAGLNYLRKLLRLNGCSDRVVALLLLLIFFGTNLLHYTVSEAGMSHVYSFALISAFMYHSNRFVLSGHNRNLYSAFLLLGLILLVRPNNVFVLLIVPIFFRSFSAFTIFLRALARNRNFYFGLLFSLLIVSVQSAVWFVQTGKFFQYTYQRDGFYWLDPQWLKMLFGADGGFFIYTPLCLLFLGGLFIAWKKSRFSFFASVAFLVLLFYFFSSYWAYTYFDGFGIRVLVDYYSFFALIGSRLFAAVEGKTAQQAALLSLSLLLAGLNLIYTYQANTGILLRSGMTWRQLKYVFLRTSPQFVNVLGGMHELKPYSKKEPRQMLNAELDLKEGADFGAKEFGQALTFDSLGFSSNRLRLLIDCSRTEKTMDASRQAQLCVVIEDSRTRDKKSYTQFPLNETPAESCCETEEYHYEANIVGNFDNNDRLSVYVWNMNKEAFVLQKLAVKVYNYEYNIN